MPQSIESFTVIATVLGRARKVHYNALDGLAIAGLHPAEAQMLVQVIERATAGTALSLVDASGAQSGRVSGGPSSPPRAAQPQRPAPAQPSRSQSAPERSPAPRPATTPPPEPRSALERSSGVSEGAPKAPSDAAPECAPGLVPERVEPPPVAGEIDSDPKRADLTPEAPAPKPKRKRKPKHPAQPETRPPERQAPKKRNAKHPEPGDKFGGVDVVAVKDHSDGGRLLVLSDGVRVKLDATGKEVVRSDEPEPDVSDVPTADERTTYPVSESLLSTLMTRDVLQHLLDHGVTDKERIIAECVKLKDRGAKAFAASKDEVAVRRRVTSTLTVMGR